MEWIFANGTQAVVTTSQLHTRGETPPIRSTALVHAFAVPAPTLSHDEVEFTLTHSSFQSSNDSEEAQYSEDDSESEDGSDLEGDKYSQLAFQVQPVRIFIYPVMVYNE